MQCFNCESFLPERHQFWHANYSTQLLSGLCRSNANSRPLYHTEWVLCPLSIPVLGDHWSWLPYLCQKSDVTFGLAIQNQEHGPSISQLQPDCAQRTRTPSHPILALSEIKLWNRPDIPSRWGASACGNANGTSPANIESGIQQNADQTHRR